MSYNIIKLLLVSFVVILGSSKNGLGQNLLPDGGFENVKNLPKAKDGKIHPYMSLEDWEPITRTAQGAFVMHPKMIQWYKLSAINFKPKNFPFYGDFEPKAGLGFVAIDTYKSLHPTGRQSYTRSYIQSKLISPLKKGETYYFSMWVRTSIESSKYFSSGLGVLLTDTSLYYSLKNLTDHYYIGASPQIYCDSVISNIGDWKKIEAYIVAKGGEQFITIGNFFPNEKLEMIENKKFTPWNYLFDLSHVFIDEVYLEKKSPFTGLLKGEKIELPAIVFNSSSEKLQKSSESILNVFVSFLKKNSNLKINIIGHTDNVGTIEKNLSLSEKRAIEVKNYLVTKGISASRIDTSGKGSTKPVTDNLTENGRKSNRRIEIELRK